MMPEKLKPCPFCGEKRLFVRSIEYDKCINVISCPSCKIEFTTPTWIEGHKSNNRKRMIEAWNRRTETQNAEKKRSET